MAVVCCSFFAARIATACVSKWLAGAAPMSTKVSAPRPAPASEETETKEQDRASYDVIVQRNIFDASNAPPAANDATDKEKDETAGADAEGPAVKTTLELKVLGTLAIGEGKDRRSTAIIESSRAKQKVDVYRVGQPLEFASNGKLVKVSKDRVEFMNGNRLEYAEIEGLQAKSTVMIGPNKPADATAKKTEAAPEEKAEGVAKLAEGKYVIDQREIDAALQNLDQLYTDIRAVPNFKDGKVAGLKLLSVRPDSLFAKLGLKRGDVLERINGIDLDIKRGLEIFNQLKEQKTLTIDIQRRGAPLTMDYEIR